MKSSQSFHVRGNLHRPLPHFPAMNVDRSKSRIVRYPGLDEDTQPADIWFEMGMIWIQNPNNPEEVGKCTVEDFADRIEAIREWVDDDVMCSRFACGKQAARRFINDAMELISESRKQLHVGQCISVISEIERSRTPISRRQGFETLSSGLLVPVS